MDATYAEIVYDANKAHAEDRLVAMLLIVLDDQGNRQLNYVGPRSDLQRAAQGLSDPPTTRTQ